MADKDSYKIAEIVTAFLKKPLDRRAFDRFFHLCYAETISYLRLLRSLGWKLPGDQVRHDNALLDMAYDVLGPFLASRRDQPYFVVFEYFERHELSDPDQITPESLCRCFRVLLRGFIRRELTYVRGLENPQIRNLKRRLRDILAGPEYGSKTWPNEKNESYFAAKNKDRLRNEYPPIAGDRLYSIVREAFVRSCTRTEWCLQIFRLLNRVAQCRNAIVLHELISIMVAVNADFADASLITGQVSTPAENYIYKQMSEIIEETIIWLETNVLNRFLKQGRISKGDLTLVLIASRHYLEDISSEGNTREIPKYFIALKPGLSQSDYLKRYKYVMETAVNRGMKEFRQRLRKDLTLWPFGNY